MKQIIFLVIAISFFNLSYWLEARSIHRYSSQSLPHISVGYENDTKVFQLFNSHLRPGPLYKTYNHEYLANKILPEKIQFKDKDEYLDTSELQKLIDNLMREIKKNKRIFKDFIVLKDRNFNNQTGLLVLKFKNYPFIFKLFMEKPSTFTDPFTKSFQEKTIFVRSGAFRHLAGFTRLRNLEQIKEKIEKDPYWSNKIVLPRKWFWLPKKPKWLMIKGYNIGDTPYQEIKIPAIYGIICDEIKGEIQRKSQILREEVLKLCSFVDYAIDPNIDNYLVDKENNKIGIIDTEYISSLIGFQAPETHDYFTWYLRLFKRFIKENFLASKEERLERQIKKEYEFPF